MNKLNTLFAVFALVVLQGISLRAQPAAGAGGASTDAGSLTQPAAARDSSTNPPAAAVPAPPQPPAAAEATATPAVPAPGPARNIRFQFDDIPYADVLERFAQMANKPLITETNVQGSMTFNDPQPYTYEEALDTLNLVLSMKQVMLIESDHYLRLVPFKQLPQMSLKILRGVDKTGDVRPGEIVTVVLEVKNLDAKEIAEAVTPMLSSAGSIAPLTRGKGLIVTDRLSNIQRIRYLLTQLDTESMVERQMKTFTLVHSSGAIVADLINRTFGVATAPKQTRFNPNTKGLDVLPPDPNDYATAVYDDGSRTLVLFGPRERVALAEELISKFEDKEGGRGGDVRIYYPQVTKAEDLAVMIRQAVPGVAGPNETAASAATKARIIVDASLNRLIVAAPIAGQVDTIENLINQVDKPVHGQGGSSAFSPLRSQTVQITKVFRPRTADAASVAKILTAALSKKMPTGVTLPTANVSVEPGSQSIVVSGNPSEVQTATDIVSQLETGTTMPLPQQTKFIEVGSATEAKRLLLLVEQLYRNQVSDGVDGQGAHAKIVVDTESGRLIVTASEDHLQKIETLVKQLRNDKPQSRSRHLQIVTLKNVPVDKVFKNITDLVTEKMSDKRFQDAAKPLLLPDAGNNRLLITADDEQFREIEQVVNIFDVIPETSNRVMSVITLQAKPAAELLPLLTQLMTQLAEDPTSPARAPKLLADPTGKQIIALATAKDQERLKALVQQFDNATTNSAVRQFRAVEMYGRNGSELTPLVQQLYQEQLKGQPEPAGGPATLLAEPVNNRIMVSGAEREIARVEAIIRQLDPAGQKGAKEETRVIRLKAAVASDLIGLIEKSLNTQSHQVKVLVDARSNSLVLTGEPGSVEAAAQIIQQLDTQSEVQPREMRIIELKAAEAAGMAPMVTSLFTEMLKDRRGSNYVSQTKLVADPTGNRLIVTGPKDELNQIAVLVEQLDRTPEQGATTRIFKLNQAEAEALAPVVSNAMMRFDGNRSQPIRRVTVAPDDKSNSLIVSGPRADLQDAAVIIEQLDGQSPDKGRALKIIPINSADADQLALLATQIFTAQNPGRKPAPFSITPEPSGKRLIVLAPASLLPQLETVIASLDQQPDQSTRELHTLSLKNGNAMEMLLMVNRIYEAQNVGKTLKPAAIYTDNSRTRLTIYGTKEQAAAIQQIVDTLESQPRGQRDTKVFEVGKLAEAQRILPVLQQLYQDQVSSNPALGSGDAQMITDGKTGRIIVSARQEQMKAIEELMSRLQTNATNQPARETRSFEVSTPAEVQRLLPIVKQLYQDQWKDKAENDPPDAQIVGDASTRRLIVSGKPDHLRQIEIIIQQFSTGQARPESRETRIFDLSTANAVELATTVRTLYQEQAKSRFGSLPADTLILPDGSANRLIVVGDTNELAQVEDIVRKLDKVSAQSATVRVFKLKAADPSKVSEILSAALVKYDAYGRSQKRISVVVDAKSRTLIAAGDPKELQGVSVIIEQLDSVGALPERKMKVVPAKTAKATDLAQKVRQLYLDQVKSQPELSVSEALIMEDYSSNQLILAGSDAQLTLIESIITELNRAQENLPRRETKLIDVGPAAELQQLLPMVQQLYQDRWKSKDAADPPSAQFMADPKNGRLIVTGPTNHLVEIEAIIQQLRAGKSEPGPRDTRVYDLSNASATELSATVRSLYLEQSKSRPGVASSDTLILPDANANRLIVSGSTNELELVESIIQKLDKTSPQAGRTRVFKLKTALAEQVALVLSTALVQTTPNGRSVPRVSIGADSQNNLLIVSGETRDLQSAAVIIEQMDAAVAREPRQMQIIPLKSGTASEVATKVKQLYQDQIKGQAKTEAADALILGDEASNRLIITGGESQVKIIQDIVSKLEEGGQGTGRQLRVILLQRNSATSIAAMIAQLFARPRINQDPAERLMVTASADDRTLVIDAPGKTLERIEQLVHTLDGEEIKSPVEVRTYQVPDGNAAELAQTLVRLFAERGGPTAAGLSPRFEADPQSSVLMVAATKDQFVQITQLIDELKQTAQVSNEIRTFALKYGEAIQIAGVLEDMLADNAGSAPGQGGGGFRPRLRNRPWGPPASDAKTVRVAPAASLNSVVVQGPPEKLLLAEKLIQTLDKNDLEGRTQIQTVHLKKAHADELAIAVNKIMVGKGQSQLQRVSVTGVESSNSLLISGPSEAVQEVLKIVRELDQESSDDEVNVRIYKLENGKAREVSTVINQLLQSVTRAQPRSRSGSRAATATVGVDERSNSLVVSGNPAHFKVVEQILPTLDKAPERGERDVHFAWLKSAKASEVASKLEAVFAGRPEGDRPVIETDLFSNSITVIAARSDLPQIDELIARLDEATRDSNIQVRLLPLARVPADQMITMLTNIYPQMSHGQIRTVDKLPPPPAAPKSTTMLAPGDTNHPPEAPAAAPPMDASSPSRAEVVIAVDKAANALILSGPASELDQIDRIVSELSFSAYSNEMELRIFALKEADPVMISRTLNELFKEEVKLDPQQQQQQQQQRGGGGDKPAVATRQKIMVVPEQRTRSVIIRAKPTDFVLLESLLKQLDVSGVSAQLEMRTVIVTNVPPQKVLPLVEQMVTQLNVIRPGEPLTVTADARSRALVVVARDSVMSQIEGIIHSLDTPSTYAEAEVRVIPIRKANASQLATILQNMLKPGTQGEATPDARELQEQVRRLKVQNQDGQAVLLDLTKPIKIMADPLQGGQRGGNRLILTSTADNLQALAAVVEMMDTVSIVEGVDVKLVQLQHTDAASISQTLTTIFTQGQRLALGPGGTGQPEGTQGKALVSPLNVAVDNRSNTLILSGQRESLELALQVIADLDQQTERFVTEVRLFRLKHASAMRLRPLLQSVFAEGGPVAGTQGLNDQVTRLRTVLENGKPKTTEQPKSRAALMIQADDTSNILIVAARSDTLPLIEDVIDQLDIPSASGLDTIRIYPLNHADAVALQKVITDLHSGPKAAQMRAEDKPNVTVDQRTNALIVSGNQKAFAIIDSLLKQLDQTLPFDLRDIRIIPLEHAESAVVATTLQRLMDARITQRASQNRQAADTLKVVVLADARSNSLLVGGSKDSFELVDTLAKQLDQAAPALSGQIRLIPLTYADVRTIGTTLTTLFTQRYAAARTPEVRRDRPVIVTDLRSNSLLVAAGMEDNQAIDELLKKLDRKIDDPTMSVKVLTLAHNDCAKVAALLENVFSARMKSRTTPGQAAVPQDQVSIEPESLNNALVVYASKENHELLQDLLDQLDVEPVISGGMIQTFTLEYADAQRVSTMLRSLVDQGLYRPGGPAVDRPTAASRRKDLAITVDPRSNTLIVSASPENLAVVKEILKRVDTQDFTELGNIRMFTLKHAKASSLSTVIEQFFRAKRTSEAAAVNATERSVAVTVIPDDRSNILLVTGGKENFDAVERIIAQLDGEDAFARMNFKVFPLKQATAAKLQSTLRQIFVNRPARYKGEVQDPITLVADSWVNGLIVGASVEDLNMVSTLVERLDSQPADAGIAVRIFPLAKADARRVAQTVQALYREGTPGVALPVIASADERMNAIVVSAGEADVKRIEELVKKLDTDQVARVSEIKVFPLRYARADTLATILNTALNTKPTPLTEVSPNTQSLLQFITRMDTGNELVTAALKEAVLITPDTRMNSLIISGPVDYMGLLEQIITRLDASSPQQAKIQVFALQHAHARQMGDLLMSMFRMQATGAQSANQRSIQYTLVKANEDAETGDLTEEELASATLGTAEQASLTVTVDPRTNSLLVGGTEHYVTMVSEIIRTLDDSPMQERKSEVYRLKNSQALDVATAIRSFLDQDRMRVTQVMGADAASTAQQMMEREASIVAEEFNNALLVSASPMFFPTITNLIEQLDQPQSQVLIQVLLAEVILDKASDLGIEWSATRTEGSTTIGTGTDFGVAKELKALGGFSSMVSGNDYNFLLRALENDGRLQVLSRPQILTADNKPASINIGQRVPVVTDSRVTQQGDSINSFQYQNVGVNLTVTPRISLDGFVKMDVSTTNSSLSSSTVDVSPSVKIPIINERRATTTVSVQSGQSIIIGGLISTADDIRTKSVPVLGRIPWIGFLFRSSRKNETRTELLILLTPQVLSSARVAQQTLLDMSTMTREQLDRSRIRDQIKLRNGSQADEYPKQLLDPLYPETHKKKTDSTIMPASPAAPATEKPNEMKDSPEDATD